MTKLLYSPTTRCLLPTIVFHILVTIIDGASAQFLVEILEPTPLGGHRPVIRCDATGANFGDDVMAFSFGLSAIGCAISTVPEDACTDVTMPPLNLTKCASYFAVVPRGNCSFSEKAYNVQSSRRFPYEALIVYNSPGQPPIPMSGSKFADQVTIPVVMVNYQCMQSLLGQYSVDNGYVVTIKATPGYYDLIKYLIPFVAVVSFCLIVLLVSLIIRVCRERRRLARKRLSRSNLKKIPTKKYKKSSGEFEFETCAICLEDFQDGEKIRILPCRHTYHCKCIDPWLTKNRKVCPICKRKVGPSSGADSSDSDNERRPSVVTRSSTRSSDNAPLLTYEQPMATTSSADFGLPSTSTSTSSAFPGHVRADATFNLSRVGRGRNSDGSISVVDSTGGSMEHLLQRGAQMTTDHEARRWPLTGASKIFSRAVNFVRRTTGRDQNRHQILEEESLSGSHDGRLDEVESGRRVRFAGTDTSNYDNPTVDGHSMTTVYSNQMTITADIEPNSSSHVEGSVVPSPPIISASPKTITMQPSKRRRRHGSNSRSASSGHLEDDDEEDVEAGSYNSKKRRGPKKHHKTSSNVETVRPREHGGDELSADDEESGDAHTPSVPSPPALTPISTSPPPEDP